MFLLYILIIINSTIEKKKRCNNEAHITRNPPATQLSLQPYRPPTPPPPPNVTMNVTAPKTLY